MRLIATWIMGGLLVAVMLSGCSGNSATSLLYDGVGSSLHQSDTLDRATQAEQYFGLMCRRAGISSSANHDGIDYCNYPAMNKNEWQRVIYASLNDIDERCEAYIESIEAARKDRAVISKQLALTSQTTGALIGFATSATGSVSLSIVQAAFGLIEQSVDNYYSRMLLKLENTTVYTVVRRQQSTYRKSLAGGYIRHVNSKPTAYYAIRGYLRLCLPSTIESEINAVIVDVHYDGGDDDKRKILHGVNPDLQALLAVPRTPKTATEPYERWERPNRHGGGQVGGVETPGNGQPPVIDVIGNAVGEEKNLTKSRGREVQRALCVAESNDFGGIDSNSKTRRAIELYEIAKGRKVNKQLSLVEINELIQSGNCTGSGYQNAYEKFRFSKKSEIEKLQKRVKKLLEKPAGRQELKAAVAEPFVTGKLDSKTRASFILIHQLAKAKISSFPSAFTPEDQMTPELLKAMDALNFILK